MADSNDLARLLSQLRGVRSPLERMKLVARAWRSVRRLGPRERNALARQIGVDGAEELIEGIAVSRGGLSPAAVQRAMDAIRGADPARLKQTLRDLQDPERRKDLIDRGLTAATDLLAGAEEPAEPEEPVAPGSPEVQGIEEEEEAPDLPEARPLREERPAPERKEAARPKPVAPAAAAVAVAAPKPSAPAREVEAPRPSRPVASAKAPPPAAKTPPVAPRATVAATPRQVVEEAPRPVEPPGAPHRPPAVAGLLEILERQATLFDRLRALREDLDLARDLGPEELRSVLDCFAPAWARRRVLNAMLEAGVPDTLHEAVFLIEQLESAADRRWCAGTLLREWDLAPDERTLVSERYTARGERAAGD